VGLSFFLAFDAHDASGEEDAGDGQGEDGVGFISVVDGDGGVYPPDDGADEPDEGDVPHSHRGYLNSFGLQCDNNQGFHYFGNRIELVRSKTALFILDPGWDSRLCAPFDPDLFGGRMAEGEPARGGFDGEGAIVITLEDADAAVGCDAYAM
jgi:hypothetical protein